MHPILHYRGTVIDSYLARDQAEDQIDRSLPLQSHQYQYPQTMMMLHSSGALVILGCKLHLHCPIGFVCIMTTDAISFSFSINIPKSKKKKKKGLMLYFRSAYSQSLLIPACRCTVFFVCVCCYF